MKTRLASRICLVVVMWAVPCLSAADVPPPASDAGTQAPGEVAKLTAAQLSDLVAPLALYPDSLLSQALVASTYPLELVQARQWLERNKGLKGKELMDAARQEGWDASVQALVAFPDVLATLTQDIEWTSALGNAFLSQESDVMAAVQRMRARAKAEGKLSSTPEQDVTVVEREGRTVIEIVPADPQVVYVPQYDPVYVWGAPAWSAYPPLAYGYGYGFGPAIDVGFWFGGWGWGWGWGWGPNWWGGSIYVDSAFFWHCGYHYGHHGGHHGGHGSGHQGGHGGGHGGEPGGGHGGGSGGGHGGEPGGGSGGGHGGEPGGGGPPGEHGVREAWRHDGSHRRGVPYTDSRVAAENQATSLASRITATSRGTRGQSADVTASSSGRRTFDAVPRRSGSDQGWREGNRSVAAGPRAGAPDRSWRDPSRSVAVSPRADRTGEGRRADARIAERGSRVGRTDQAWRTAPEPPRRSAGVSRGEGPSARYAPPSSRYQAPSRSYSPPSRSYSGPSRSYEAPSRSYSGPSRSYEAPSRSYSGPSRSYSGPSPSYSPPSRSYAPAPRGDSSPSRSYSAPSRSFSSPPSARGSQSAPRSFSSGGGARSFGGGGSPGGGRRH